MADGQLQDDDRLADYQVRLEAAVTEIANLHTALTTAREIGMAVGILMASRKLSADAAFDLMRLASQSSNRKVRDIAADIVLTGEIF